MIVNDQEIFFRGIIVTKILFSIDFIEFSNDDDDDDDV